MNTSSMTCNLSDPRVIHTTIATTYDGNNCGSQGYDYGNVSKQDETANDVSGTHIIGTTQFCPNDNIGGGTYLTDLPASASVQDASGTQYGCSANFYGGNSSYLTQPTLPDVTRTEDHTSYSDPSNDCTAAGTTIATQHSYDASGNAITGTDPDNHLGCTSGSNQYTACAVYDSTDTQLVSATNAKNQVVTYDYDPQAPEAGFGEWLMSSTDANGQTTTYQYDALGRLTAVIKPGDSVSSPTITYSYINTCSAGSTKPCLELDTSTRLTVGGSTMVTQKQWYDGWGNLIETQVPGPNLFSKVPAIGSKLISYTIYDNMDRATTKSLNYAVAATAGLAYVAPDLTQPRTVTAYDSMGRPLGSVTYGNGSTIVTSSTLSYTIAQGVPTISSESSNAYEQTIALDAYNHQSISYTDGLGRMRYEQIFSGTSSPYAVVSSVGDTYDVRGDTLAVNTYDSTGTIQARVIAIYDGLNRELGYNDSDRGSCLNIPMPADCSSSTDTAWKNTYDADSNLLSQTDPRNQTTYTSYDALDRPLCRGTSQAAVNPCQNSASDLYFYDSYNNSSNPGVTFPAGCTAPSGSLASDPVGEVVAEVFGNAAGSGWRCGGFDARGEVDQSTLSVIADSHTTTQTVSANYNDASAIASMTYPDGEVISPSYDNSGYLRGISDPNGSIIGNVQYTNAGQLASMTVGGLAYQGSATTPLTLTTSYDSVQRPLATSASVNGSTLMNQQRTYDNVGNVLSLNTSVTNTTGTTVVNNQSFCYDALSELVWAGNSGTPTGGDHCGTAPSGSTIAASQQAFSYDALGRLTSGPSGSETYGDGNHPHAVTALSTAPNQYASYDAMGNMTCRNTDTTTAHTCAGSSPTGAQLSYDNEGHLVSWSSPSGGTTSSSDQFLYDAEGNRVLQRASSTTGGTTTVSDTITFDSYTETTITNGTTSTTKYYSAGGSTVAMAQGTNCITRTRSTCTSRWHHERNHFPIRHAIPGNDCRPWRWAVRDGAGGY